MNSHPNFAPERCHAPLLQDAPKVLSFANSFASQFGSDFTSWHAAVQAQLREIVGGLPLGDDLNLRVEWQRQHDEFEEIRFLFSSEPNADVPCHTKCFGLIIVK